MTNASTAPQFDIGPLTWVKSEIDLALERAAQALDQFADHPQDTTQIKFCRTHLHQVRGALAIVGLDGLTQFTDALESLLADIEQGRQPADGSRISLLGGAVDATRQYLDDLIAGESDQPLRLFDTYRQLVQARGQPAPSGSDLFFPDLSVRPALRPMAALPPGAGAQKLRNARARFQKGLLAWLKAPDQAQGPQELQLAAVEISGADDAPVLRTFWWTVSGLFAAVAEHKCGDEAQVRHLLPRIDQQIRRQFEGSRTVPERLMRDVLFNVAISRSERAVVKEIRRSYGLDGLLPSHPADGGRAAQIEPIAKRLREIASAAEDAWSKFCGGAAQSLGPFREASAMLHQGSAKLENTDFRRLTQAVAATCAWLAEDPKRHGEALAIEMATAILVVGNALENFGHLGSDFVHQVDVIVARLHACIAGNPLADDAELPGLDEMSRRAQERLLIAQVVREIQSNLGQIEQALDTYFRDATQREALGTLKGPLHQIEGALTILGQDAAVRALRASGERIGRFAAADYVAAGGEFEAVANQLSALGFFVESLQSGAADYEQFVRELEAGPGNRRGTRGGEFSASEEAPAAAPAVAPPAAVALPTAALPAAATAVAAAAEMPPPAPPVPETPVPAPPPAAPAAAVEVQASAEEIDAELLEIFLEEAAEVLENIATSLDTLRNRPGDVDALTTVRRAFHTLKGSSRMVGLKDFGEVAWAIEQVHNLWLRQELKVTDELLGLDAHAHESFGAWVACLASGEGSPPDTTTLVATAERLRGLETPAAPAPSEPAAAESVEASAGMLDFDLATAGEEIEAALAPAPEIIELGTAEGAAGEEIGAPPVAAEALELAAAEVAEPPGFEHAPELAVAEVEPGVPTAEEISPVEAALPERIEVGEAAAPSVEAVLAAAEELPEIAAAEAPAFEFAPELAAAEAETGVPAAEEIAPLEVAIAVAEELPEEIAAAEAPAFEFAPELAAAEAETGVPEAAEIAPLEATLAVAEGLPEIAAAEAPAFEFAPETGAAEAETGVPAAEEIAPVEATLAVTEGLPEIAAAEEPAFEFAPETGAAEAETGVPAAEEIAPVEATLAVTEELPEIAAAEAPAFEFAPEVGAAEAETGVPAAEEIAPAEAAPPELIEVGEAATPAVAAALAVAEELPEIAAAAVPAFEFAPEFAAAEAEPGVAAAAEIAPAEAAPPELIEVGEAATPAVEAALAVAEELPEIAAAEVPAFEFAAELAAAEAEPGVPAAEEIAPAEAAPPELIEVGEAAAPAVAAALAVAEELPEIAAAEVPAFEFAAELATAEAEPGVPAAEEIAPAEAAPPELIEVGEAAAPAVAAALAVAEELPEIAAAEVPAFEFAAELATAEAEPGVPAAEEIAPAEAAPPELIEVGEAAAPAVEESAAAELPEEAEFVETEVLAPGRFDRGETTAEVTVAASPEEPLLAEFAAAEFVDIGEPPVEYDGGATLLEARPGTGPAPLDLEFGTSAGEFAAAEIIDLGEPEAAAIDFDFESAGAVAEVPAPALPPEPTKAPEAPAVDAAQLVEPGIGAGEPPAGPGEIRLDFEIPAAGAEPAEAGAGETAVPASAGEAAGGAETARRHGKPLVEGFAPTLLEFGGFGLPATPAPAAPEIVEERVDVEIPPVEPEAAGIDLAETGAAAPQQTITVSPALHDIFVEEAHQHLAALQEEFGQLEIEPAAPSSNEMVRAAHTLGSIAGTVGFPGIKRLGHALEDALLRRANAAQPGSLEALETISESIAELERMVTAVTSHQAPGDADPLVAALQPLYPAAGAIAATVAAVGQPAVSEEIPEDSLDADLLPIFLEEASDLVGGLTERFAMWRGNPADSDSIHALARLLHTLKGSARMAGAMRVGALTHQLESRVENAHKTGAVDPARIDELQAAFDDIAIAIEDLRTAPLPAAGAAAEAEPAPLAEFVEAAAPAAEPAAEPPPTAPLTASVADLGMVPPPLPPAPEPIPDDHIDEQLLPIFLEEASELTSAVYQQLDALRADPNDTQAARGLARSLHTIKGSARMAGAMSLGFLTHTLETRIEEAAHGAAPDPALIDEVRASFDTIAGIVERLQHGEKIAAITVEVPAALAAPAGVTAGPPGSLPESLPEPPPEPVAIAAAPEAAAPVAVAIAGKAKDEGHAKAMLRVRAEMIDQLVNDAGELSIARARIEGEMRQLKQSLLDLTENVIRLRRQLREVEIQAESQMQSKVALTSDATTQFDPLELDRFTRFQELTRMMAESVNDVATVQQNLLKNLDEANAALAAQSRLNRELQQQLMAVRMVPFASITERLYRIVRQTARELGKRTDLEIRGSQLELDQNVINKMIGPFEHLLRNAIAHGIEPPDVRRAAGKDEMGEISLSLRQEGNEVVIVMEDDGGGLHYDRIRAKAIANGLLRADEDADDRRLAEMIFNSGFSTATQVTQVSGRGVGMDVVKTEVASLGGRIDISSTTGRGTVFRIYLPLTLAVTNAVLIRVGSRTFAIPASTIDQVQEIKEEPLAKIREAGRAEWQGNIYPFRFLGHLLGEPDSLPEARRQYWVMLLHSGEQRIAVQVDELMGTREIVVKNIGPQLARVVGIAGATVLGDGRVVLILNPVALAARTPVVAAVRAAVPAAPVEAPAEQASTLPTVFVVDDSLTVRKITGRLLAREGYQVITAKDGVDALEQLTALTPDVIISDIEMPRMDGFELARNIRNDERLGRIPIIMITSRTAEKHRSHAMELGVNNYLGKPYQEDELLGLVAGYVAAHRSRH